MARRPSRWGHPAWALVVVGASLAVMGGLSASGGHESAAPPPRPRLRPAPSPAPTPTASPTPPPTPRPNVNLTFVTPPDWMGCVVCNFRWLSPPRYEFLSILHPTHVVWAVANQGPSSVFGPIEFALLLDGTRFLVVRYDNPVAFFPGTALGMHLATQVTTPGRHTLTVAIDADNRIAETNEADNVCAFAAVWSTEPISLLPPEGEHGGAAAGALMVVDLDRR